MGDYMSKEEFKNYVRNNRYVKESVDRGETTWQKAYEAYDLYGESAPELVALKKEDTVEPTIDTNTTMNQGTNSINPMLLSLAALDWNQVSHAVDNLSRMVGMAKDVMGKGEAKETKAQQVFRRYND